MLCRAAAFHTSNCSLERRTKIDLQRVCDAEQGVDRGNPFALLYPHYHRMTETGSSGDFIERKLLPKTCCPDQFDQSGNDRFALRSF